MVERTPSGTANVAIGTLREPRAFWLSPVVVTAAMGVVALVPAAVLGDRTFRALWRTPKSVDGPTIVLFACGVFALMLGVLIGRAAKRRRRGAAISMPWPAIDDGAARTLRRASTVSTALTVIGYAGFVVLVARSGLGMGEVFSGSPAVKDAVGTVPGVTTLTQFGVVAVVASSLLLTRSFSRGELTKLSVIVLLGLLRAFVNSERLAAMEIIVPIMVVFAAALAAEPGRRRRIAQLFPAVFLGLVVAIFALTSYFRSWGFYRAHSGFSFPVFVLTRITGYYTTATNNGYLNLTEMRRGHGVPYDTISALWNAPGVDSLRLYSAVDGHAPPISEDGGSDRYTEVLQHFANPEFNSESGYAGPFVDYGTLGGVVVFVLIGVAIGIVYRAFCEASPYGLLLYPVVFTGLLELPRYMYWSYGRTTYAWLGLGIIVLALAVRRSRAVRSG